MYVFLPFLFNRFDVMNEKLLQTPRGVCVAACLPALLRPRQGQISFSVPSPFAGDKYDACSEKSVCPKVAESFPGSQKILFRIFSVTYISQQWCGGHHPALRFVKKTRGGIRSRVSFSSVFFTNLRFFFILGLIKSKLGMFYSQGFLFLVYKHGSQKICDTSLCRRDESNGLD